MDNTNVAPHGIICTPEEYNRSLSDTSIRCLTRGESIGLTIVSEAGLISLIAVSYVFTIILRNIAWRIRHVPREKSRVFHHPMDLLMFSLFSADVLQAIGAVMDIRWIQQGKVEVGRFCNAQGVIQQLGETGVAMTTLMIGVFTFLGIWIGKDIRSVWLTRCILGAAWSFILLMVILGNTIHHGNKKHYQSPTPYWCWISSGYLQWRIWGEYFWFWITLTFSFAIYIPLYLWSRGNIRIDDHTWWKFTFQRSDPNADPALKVIRRRAMVMLAYPLVYCLSILPLSVERWITFVHPNSVSGTATFAVTALYGLSGACNVVLLLTTRPESVLFSKPMDLTSDSGRAPSLLMEEARSTQEVMIKEQDKGDTGLGRLPSRS
ncbi:hypothetical protein BDZ97DRAFT_2054852 [Flammula alnicola]|nr:hypothetical protein BDZ97DRAFT_2054852 [Flammula alnicola]